jgi:oxygen-independent coproporphyrinogen-3 oxidase
LSPISADYINALCKEIGLRKRTVNGLKTIYIGGGTPTVLSEEDISKVLNTVRENCSINQDAEITIEANPRTITEEKAEALLKSGMNRISIGIQSFIDSELSMLGRSHSSDDAIKAVRDVRNAGFRNVSIDLMYGIPSLKFQISNFKSQIRNWEYSLGKAVELSPEHISIYELTPEKNTPLYQDIESAIISMPDEETISEMYYRGIDTLKKHGYVHYEISNLAKSGYKCIHNLNYWNRGEYLGIGAGAHSFFNERRIGNVRNVLQYIELLNNGRAPTAEEIKITEDEALKEYIFLGLRKTEGIDIRKIPVIPPIPPLVKGGKGGLNNAVEELLLHGFVELKDSHLRLTKKGLLLSSEVIVKILLCIEKTRLL